jgi:L-arabinokinase
VASVVFYISGHGFGHASRQIEVINALAARDPGTSIVIRTSAARLMFDRTVAGPFTFIDGPCDTGVVQRDSLRLDEAATIRQAADFYSRLPQLAEGEAAFLRRHEARLVVADAPPLACAAAAVVGVPSVVLANFTWDWIYEGYPGPLASAPELIATIRGAYQQASAGWRLPLSGGFDAIAKVTDVPFIARHAGHDRDTTRRALALPRDRPLVLSSFGGHGVTGLDTNALDCRDEYGVVITGDAPPDRLAPGIHFVREQRIYDHGLRYEDLVAAVDVVVSKPGFGIIAECVANDTALLYTSRGRFREYDVMVAEMPRILRCGFISHGDLFAGRWRAGLDRVLALPAAPQQVATNGAEVAAALLGHG